MEIDYRLCLYGDEIVNKTKGRCHMTEKTKQHGN